MVCKSKTALLFLLDETDVAAAFDVGVADVLDFFSSHLQPQILVAGEIYGKGRIYGTRKQIEIHE